MSENEIKPGELAAVKRLERACMAGGWVAAQIQSDDVQEVLRYIDRLTAERDDLNALLMALQARHREVMAERDAAGADADRYQWLVDSGRFCPSFYNKGWGLRSGAFERATKESLDAAIDAAMAEGE